MTQRLRQWTVDEFAGAREAWSGLLKDSAADGLFLSWEWLWHWWNCHAQSLGAELRLLAVHKDGELVGLAPFHLRRARSRFGIKVRRLEIIGSAWRETGAAYSEYLDLLVRRGEEDLVLRELAAALSASEDWDELVFANTRPGSLLDLLIHRLPGTGKTRRVDHSHAAQVQLAHGFDQLSGSWSSDTRRKVLHQRRKVADARLEFAQEREVEAYLDGLRAHRQKRWGTVESTEEARFFEALAASMAASGQLRLSRLRDSAGLDSFLYCIRVGDTEYFLQSGYAPQAGAGVSPGYLHLGFAMERAAAEGCRIFDLLAGPGRNRDYKADFAPALQPLVCLHYLRAPWLKLLYRLHGLLGRQPKSG